MDPFEPKKPETVNWWIASLAASSLLCCTFAGYVFNIKEDLNNAKIRSEVMEQRVDVLSSQVDNLRRRVMLQQALVVSSEKNAQPPSMPEAQPVETAPAPQAVPSPPPVAAQPPKH